MPAKRNINNIVWLAVASCLFHLYPSLFLAYHYPAKLWPWSVSTELVGRPFEQKHMWLCEGKQITGFIQEIAMIFQGLFKDHLPGM